MYCGIASKNIRGIIYYLSYFQIDWLVQSLDIIVQTYLKTLNLQNAYQIYFVECVSKIKHNLSVIHCTLNGTVCFQCTHSLMMTEKIYTLSYYHHQIGSMNHNPLFRVRSWNNGMRCMSLYSYKFVIWPDCFVGHLCPGCICSESTGMQHYYHAR